MSGPKRRGTWIIVLTFVLAYLASSAPIPETIARYAPDWPSLTLIFWVMMLPDRVGVASGWITGLFLDGARNTLLGQNALALALVAFIVLKTQHRARVLPLPLQALNVAFVLVIHQFLVAWMHGVMGYPPTDWWYLAPALSGMLLWPLFAAVMNSLRRRYGIV